MAVTLPTVDDFTETTVLTMIRKVVDYLCSDSGLVAQINNNDITGFTSSYTSNVLKINATKGDGTTIPVCNLTIQGGSSTGNPYPTGITGTVGADGNITFTVTMSSGSPLTTTINMNYFASADDLSVLQEQVSGIKPTVTVNDSVSPPTITVAVNGKSSTTNLPASASVATGTWEELDITNLPNDFTKNDVLMVTIKGRVEGGTQPTSWDTAPSQALNIGYSEAVTIILKLDSISAKEFLLDFGLTTNKCISYTVWRAPAGFFWQTLNFRRNELGTLRCITFNGGGAVERYDSITFDEISSLFTRMWRLKQ